METTTYLNYKCVAGIRDSPCIVCRRQIEKCTHWDFHRSSCGRSIDFEIFRSQFEHGLCQAHSGRHSHFVRNAFLCVRVNAERKVRQISVKIAADDSFANQSQRIFSLRTIAYPFDIMDNCQRMAERNRSNFTKAQYPHMRCEDTNQKKMPLWKANCMVHRMHDVRKMTIDFRTFRRLYTVHTNSTRISIIQIASVHLIESEQKKNNKQMIRSSSKNARAPTLQSCNPPPISYVLIHSQRMRNDIHWNSLHRVRAAWHRNQVDKASEYFGIVCIEIGLHSSGWLRPFWATVGTFFFTEA